MAEFSAVLGNKMLLITACA